MNATQNQTVEFLNAAIHNKKVNISEKDIVNWDAVLDEARAHSITSLVYSAVAKSEAINYMDNTLLNKWKKETFFSGTTQLNHIKEMSRVLGELSNNNIPVIALKGLVVRAYYPKPELRTMCDSDLLVHREDLEKVKIILQQLGYYEYSRTTHDIKFVKKGCLSIELHWALLDEGYMEKIENFEKEIWKNTIEVKVGNAKVLSLCLEDLALYLFIHMVKHILDRGFGIRQLADLVLLIEKNGSDIKWDELIVKGRYLGIEKFILVILAVCNKLFSMELPKELGNLDKVNKSKNVYLFINDIFKGGVYGKREMHSSFANELAYNPHNKEENNSIGVLKRFLLFIFPPIDKLSDKYNYAKKNKILAPIAWIHHVFAGIFNKEYSLLNKIKFATSSMSISQKRNKMIQWLEL